MNNMEIRRAIKENWELRFPDIVWTKEKESSLGVEVMMAERAMKRLREEFPGMSRLEAFSEVRNEFLLPPDPTDEDQEEAERDD